MAQIRSIDVAARGYIRHRFVRALNASFVVLIIFAFIALVVGAAVYATSAGQWEQLIGAPLGALLVFVLFVVPTVFVIGVVTAIVDGVHRRVVGLLLFAGGFTLMALLCMALLGFALPLLGVAARESTAEIGVRGTAAFALFGAIISYQLMRHGWWQMTARADDYRATRGWRPPPWRFITGFRRHLGLPSFLAYVGKKRLGVSLLYFCVAVLNLGLAVLLIMPIMLTGAEDQATRQNMIIMGATLGGLLLLNLIGAGALLSRLADNRATRLYQNVREWDARAPIIFLRAFDQDDARLKARSGDAFARWPAGVGWPRTLDEILLEHGSPYGPVIAVGDPRAPTPPLGAARVFVQGEGEEWQGVVRGLAGASKAVIMCPNHGEGVQWELDLIAQAGGRLHVIFLASPELLREATLALFKRLVPHIPAIDAKQHPIAAYEIGGEWRVLTTRQLSVDSYTAALNTALQALFGLKGEPVKRPKKAA